VADSITETPKLFELKKEFIRDERAFRKKTAAASAAHYLQQGKRLIEMQNQLEHGEFMDWVKSLRDECSHRTATNYMKVAGSGLKLAMVANLIEQGGIKGVLKHISEAEGAGPDNAKAVSDSNPESDSAAVSDSEPEPVPDSTPDKPARKRKDYGSGKPKGSGKPQRRSADPRKTDKEDKREPERQKIQQPIYGKALYIEWTSATARVWQKLQRDFRYVIANADGTYDTDPDDLVMPLPWDTVMDVLWNVEPPEATEASWHGHDILPSTAKQTIWDTDPMTLKLLEDYRDMAVRLKRQTKRAKIADAGNGDPPPRSQEPD
jgi:DUF3102 family protein